MLSGRGASVNVATIVTEMDCTFRVCIHFDSSVMSANSVRAAILTLRALQSTPRVGTLCNNEFFVVVAILDYDDDLRTRITLLILY